MLVGQEIRTTAGDLIGLFLHETVPPGLSPAAAVAAVRAQGGLVGIAHPFDRFRGSVGRGESAELDALAGDGRLDRDVERPPACSATAMDARPSSRSRVGIPGVAVSDAHTTMELGIAATILAGDPSTAEGLRAALAGPAGAA